MFRLFSEHAHLNYFLTYGQGPENCQSPQMNWNHTLSRLITPVHTVLIVSLNQPLHCAVNLEVLRNNYKKYISI